MLSSTAVFAVYTAQWLVVGMLGIQLMLSSISPPPLAVVRNVVRNTLQSDECDAQDTTQDSTKSVAKAICNVTKEMRSLAVPLGIFGFTCAVLAFVAVPLLPDWASGMKGYFQKALVCLGLISIIPAIVNAIYTVGKPT